MNKSDGMNYAPTGKPNPVVKGEEFPIAAAALDHGHIHGMCNGLTEAGAFVKYVYDPDPKKVEAFKKSFPSAKAVSNLDEILGDPTIKMVAGAAITSERCALGLKVLKSGKHYFTDKAPMTTLQQLEQAKAAVAETKRKYMCYFSERLHVESAVFAGKLIQEGAIGKVVQVLGMGPHRLNAAARPDWFFKKEQYGGILCDIGSHQVEQFLFYTGNTEAEVVHSQVGNYHNPSYPELEDFGDANILGANGATQYFRVDWFSPEGLGTWGDGRTFILGTDGYIELRKYINVATSDKTDHVFLVNGTTSKHFEVSGQVGFPFFGEMILDCLHGTEKAMTQAHVFKAAELCIKAQIQAVKVH